MYNNYKNGGNILTKKKSIYILCCLLVIMFTTGCDNQKVENSLISLCDKIEQDIESYQSTEITRDELYSKVEEYNSDCQEQMNDICIYIKSIMAVPTDRQDIQESYTKKILTSCKQERETQ